VIYEGESYHNGDQLLEALGRVESVRDVEQLDRNVKKVPEYHEMYKGVLNYVRMRNVAMIMGRI
jgi:hypothetical protein